MGRRTAGIAIAIAALALTGCGNSGHDGPLQAIDPPPGRKTAIFDPGLYATAAQDHKATLDQIAALGADTVRMSIRWRETAPADPRPAFDPSDPGSAGYDWREYDRFARQAAARGLDLMVTVGGPAPDWASTGRDGLENPDPEAFGRFAEAAARRFRGRVALWSVWNEPNQEFFLQPQLVDGAASSPLLYRRLYLAAQEGIAGADPGAPLLAGELAPTGGGDAVSALAFLRGFLCLDAQYRPVAGCEGGPVEADGFAMHPYLLPGEAPFEGNDTPEVVTMGTVQRLVDALDRAAAAGAIDAELPVYITEYGVQTEPDPLAGVPVEQQAEYLALSEWLAYENPRVASYGQYLLRDDPPDLAPGEEYGGFESGLRFFEGGEAKPAYDGYRLPLAGRREGDSVELWGLVRPAAGRTEAEIWVRDARPSRLLERVESDRASIVRLFTADAPGRQWQLRWSDGEETFAGAWVRAYDFQLPQP